ncbi:MAG: PUA domain-containing protein, partial [Thermoplasmata archaeon]
QAIQEGKLFELAAIRARGHPALHEALEVMLDEYSRLNVIGPIGKTASVFYTGPETARRPELAGFHQRLVGRYPYLNTKTVLLVPHLGDRPFSETASVAADMAKKTDPEELIVVFVTPMGVVPWELEHVHPAQQCVFPKVVDELTLRSSAERLRRFLGMISYKNAVWLRRDAPTGALHEEMGGEFKIKTTESADSIDIGLTSRTEQESWPARKVSALMAHQWGMDSKKLRGIDHLETAFSRSTGKIRHIKKAGDILFTLVPNNGLLAPTYKGGLELLDLGIANDYIVTMDSSVAEFVSKGRSALAKFVKHASQNLVAGEEVLVADEESNLIGVGRAVLDGNEMLAFKRGVAVATRHSKGP